MRACIGLKNFFLFPILGSLTLIIIYTVCVRYSTAPQDSECQSLRVENEDLKRQLAVFQSEKKGAPIGGRGAGGGSQPLTTTNLKGLEAVIEVKGGKGGSVAFGFSIQNKSRIEKGDSDQPWFQNYILPLVQPQKWKQHRFATHGSYGFIQYSGYRRAPDSFTLVGLTPTGYEKRSLQGCLWVGGVGGAHLRGNLSLHYEQEPFNMQVEEDLSPPSEFRHFLSYCSAGLHDAMVATHLLQFLHFHRVVHSVQHFYLYDAGAVDADMRAGIAPLLEAGVVSITDLRSTLLFSVKMWGQPLAIQDCIQRTRFTAKWIFLIDTDEYLFATPPHTLRSLLTKHEDKSWLTHGAYTFDLHYCEKKLGGTSRQKEEEGAKEGRYIIETMLWADPYVYCHHNHTQTPEVDCIVWEGHRKVIMNPRKVFTSGVHDVKDSWGGVHLNAVTELRHYHYRGLSSRREEGIHLCTKVGRGEGGKRNGTKSLEGGVEQGEGGEEKYLSMGGLWDLNGLPLARNEEVANYAAKARKCPLGSKEVRGRMVLGGWVGGGDGSCRWFLSFCQW